MKSPLRRRFSGIKLILPLVLLIVLVSSVLAIHASSFAVTAGNSITVMTRNLYVGAAFDPLLNVPTPDDIPERVAQVYSTILSSRFPCRAEAIADEIVQIHPDLVGLQEAALLRVQSPCGTSVQNPPQPISFTIDYLQILLDALESRGAHYAVATSITNTDVTVTSVTGDTIRLTDRDVILVRTDLSTNDLRVSKAQAKNFDARFTVQIGGPGGPSVTVLRGWCSVDAKIRGKSVRVVNTHLEEASPLIRAVQANELLAGPLHTTLPIISLGDFNASVGSTPYGNFLTAGFQDAWTLAHPDDPGFSCCQAEDLLNPTSQLNTRIDLVFFKSGRISVDSMELVGASPTDRLPSGQWPSDHAGVVGTLLVK